MRTSTFLLIAAYAILSPFHSNAETTADILTSGDRTWNYCKIHYYGAKPIDRAPCGSVRFTGTDNRYGKDYSVLTCSENPEDTVALIREENGKVFLCADSPELVAFGISHESVRKDEYQIYDFNATTGEKYPGLGYSPYGYVVCEVEVLKVDTITAGERNLRRQKVRAHNEWDKESEYNVIEGIGNNADWFFLPPYHDCSTGQVDPHYSVRLLENATDGKGDTVINGTDFYDRGKGETFAKTVRQGRTWVYSASKENGDAVVELRLGDRKHTEYGYYWPILDQKGDSLALVSDWQGSPSVDRYGYDDPEILKQRCADIDMFYGGYDVYRFDAAPGQKYRTLGLSVGQDRYKKLEVTVLSVDTIMVAGEKCRRQTLGVEGRPGERFVAVEGIGINLGWLHMPAWGDKGAEGAAGVPMLKEVRDADGNVIFEYKDFGPDAGVNDIHYDITSADSRKYDLNGREIRNPEPGTVYIQGGRKHVAPRR